MNIGGKVEGITSDKISDLDGEAHSHRREALEAMIDFYSTDDEAARALAEERVQVAYRKAMSAEKQRNALEDIRADAQANREQIGKWAKLF